MELRPGAPADSGICILFAVEPPGTALLIAVLEGDDAIRTTTAKPSSSPPRPEGGAGRTSGRAPEAAAHTFGDAQSFLKGRPQPRDNYVGTCADAETAGKPSSVARRPERNASPSFAQRDNAAEECQRRPKMTAGHPAQQQTLERSKS